MLVAKRQRCTYRKFMLSTASGSARVQQTLPLYRGFFTPVQALWRYTLVMKPAEKMALPFKWRVALPSK
jgi:hypothetical protein